MFGLTDRPQRQVKTVGTATHTRVDLAAWRVEYPDEVVDIAKPRVLHQRIRSAKALRFVAEGTSIALGDPIAFDAWSGDVVARAQCIGIFERSTVFSGGYLALIDTSTSKATPPPPDTSQPSLVERLSETQLTGLGGGGFPAAQKVKAALDGGAKLLLINAVECEPDLGADVWTLKHGLGDVGDGISALMKLGSFGRVVLTVCDAGKHLDLPKPTGIEVERAVVPNGYPGGEERQLLREVFNIFLEPLERASERGVLVLNIGTVAALGAIARGGCPESRLVAVRGTAVGNPQLCRVRVGTPISVVLDALGIQGTRVEVYSGGAVMHERVISFDEPVCWSTTGLLVETKGMDFDPVAVQQPCIRCDACLPVCPEGLSPLKLWDIARRGREEPALESHWLSCTQCRACDLVCPSHIPLAMAFAEVAGQILIRREEQRNAERAKARFERHERRAAKRAVERAQRVERKARSVDTTRPPNPVGDILAAARSKRAARSSH